MDYKSFAGGFSETEAGEPGSFVARICTLNVRDHDGDVLLPGCLNDGAAVKIAATGHNYAVPAIGRGVIKERGNEGLVSGAFFLDTELGRQTYLSVKGVGALQEWSFGYEVTESERGKWQGEPARMIRRLTIFECSPVMRGSSIGSALLSIKGLHRAAVSLYQAREGILALEYELRRSGALLGPGQLLSELEDQELESLQKELEGQLTRPPALTRRDRMLRRLLAADRDDPEAQPRGRYAEARLSMWIDEQAAQLKRNRPDLMLSDDQAAAIVRRWLARA